MTLQQTKSGQAQLQAHTKPPCKAMPTISKSFNYLAIQTHAIKAHSVIAKCDIIFILYYLFFMLFIIMD